MKEFKKFVPAIMLVVVSSLLVGMFVCLSLHQNRLDEAHRVQMATILKAEQYVSPTPVKEFETLFVFTDGISVSTTTLIQVKYIEVFDKFLRLHLTNKPDNSINIAVGTGGGGILSGGEGEAIINKESPYIDIKCNINFLNSDNRYRFLKELQDQVCICIDKAHNKNR